MTWQGPNGDPQLEEGEVSVMARLLFVGGVKRRRLADLRAPPERAGDGEVILTFGERDRCTVKFDRRQSGDEFARLVLAAAPGAGAPGASGAGLLDGGAANWERAVRQAAVDAQSQSFQSPLPDGSSGAFSGAQVSQTWRLVADVCAAWEASDRRRQKTHGDVLALEKAGSDESARIRRQLEGDHRNMEAELREAHSRVESLEKKLRLQVEENAALQQQLNDSERADVERMRFLEAELVALRQRLKESADGVAPRAAKVRRQKVSPGLPARSALGQEGSAALARHMALLEAGPLGRCPQQERPALRKALLLKWNPRDQASAEHSAFATCVLDVLQNLPEWS